jgi:co-chaperonin GroES (HSP10)
MSNFSLEPGSFALPEAIHDPIQDTIQPVETTAEEKARQLPDPTGWKILCAVPDVVETFENSSIVKAGQFMKQEEHATTVLFVVKVGPDAYGDKTKFPGGPWCKEGDFVLVRTYSGTRFKIYGKEFRLLNDDQVDAVVQDPRGLTRA